MAACNCRICCSNFDVDVDDAGVEEDIGADVGADVAPGFAIIAAGAGLGGAPGFAIITAGAGLGVTPGFAILGVGSGFCPGKFNASRSCQPRHISRASSHR